jgi:hypothetical protein
MEEAPMNNIVPLGALTSADDRHQRVGLTAVIPCFNEADGIDRTYEEVVSELSGYDLELLFVDDGSTDATLGKIKRLAARDGRVRYISFSRNFGQEAAFGAGFTYASQPWIAQMDADLQSPPSEVGRLLDRALEGDVDVVFGLRRNRQDPWTRRKASQAQHWIARRLLGIDIPAGASTFRVIRTSVAKKITGLQLGTPYFIASVAMVGARATTLPVLHRRRDGRSRYALRRLVTHALDLFFGFSLRPLALLHGFAAAAGLMLVAGPLLVATGLTTALAPAASLLVLQVLCLCALSVLGRYLMGMVRQTQPFRYLVREANVPIRPADLLDEWAPATQLVSVSGRSSANQSMARQS